MIEENSGSWQLNLSKKNIRESFPESYKKPDVKFTQTF